MMFDILTVNTWKTKLNTLNNMPNVLKGSALFILHPVRSRGEHVMLLLLQPKLQK